MNETVSKVGDQIKQAFAKVGEAWKNQEPARKRLILIIGAGLIALALGLVVFLNVRSGRYTVLYASMSQDESVLGKGILETAQIPSRINSEGQLEVPSKYINRAMGQLAMQGIPSTTLDYNILADASGLTTTEFEKRTALTNQWQNRLQDIIRSLEGVQNAFVTLKIDATNSNRVWDSQATQNSGSVVVHMKPGYVLTNDQAYAIRFLVGSSVGIAPEEVTVMDGAGNLLAAPGQAFDAQAAATSSFLERMDLEREIETRLSEKTANLLTLLYPEPDSFRISCTAQLDFDAMVTEMKEYFPLEGTIHGVVDQEELQAQMGLGQLTGGVVGETDNTDVPIYVDLNGDGQPDAVDFSRFRDYAVSYTLKQIEKGGPSLATATISVVINDSITNETRQSMRESIAQATNVPVDNISVQSFLVGDNTNPPGGNNDGTTPATILGIPVLFFYIAVAVLVLLIVVLILVAILRSKAKKKRLLAEQAELEAEQAEADRIQQEIEERKKQLKDAAIGDQSENAITNEVREFARNNPEITANLLRNWLKEGE